jgi:hypothetical protein
VHGVRARRLEAAGRAAPHYRLAIRDLEEVVRRSTDLAPAAKALIDLSRKYLDAHPGE